MTIKNFLSKIISQDWYNLLNEEFDKEYFIEISNIIKSRRKYVNVYPESKDVFNVFKDPYENIKVVILGQDPYYTAGMATGYAFDIPETTKKIPPSLINIFKEMNYDFKNGSLKHLIKQGVFLFNTALTVEENCPNVHKKLWTPFTKKVLTELNNKDDIVFMLWGTNAISYQKILTNKRNLILTSGHPSPLSANQGKWFGNNHFETANNFLKEKIKWTE